MHMRRLHDRITAQRLEESAPAVKAGDTVLFGKYSGQEARLDGVDYLIMREDDILAVHSAGATSSGARDQKSN